MFDAIVVGARAAGSPTAMLLAKQGYRVLLLDKARFPSDTMSTHWLLQPGVERLQRWGLLESVLATGCPPFKKIVYDFGPVVIAGSPTPTATGVKYSYCPRRKYLDNILVQAAVRAGVEFREAFSVTGLEWEGDRVVGIKGRTQDGPEVVERARIVIGADGMRSNVATWVKAPETRRYDGPTTPCYYNYFADFPIDRNTTEIIVRAGWGAGLMPTNDGLTCMIVGFKPELFPDYRSDPSTAMKAAVSQDAKWGAWLAQSKPVERTQGILALPAFYRRPYGPGWALVGDAGYWRHPFSAQGISDCFRDSESLAEAIGDGFAGRRSLEEGMVAYETKRDQSTKAIYDSTNERAALEPLAPHVLQLLHALEGNQEAMDQFLGLDAGTVQYQDFFAPANMEKIFAQAAARGARAPQGAMAAPGGSP